MTHHRPRSVPGDRVRTPRAPAGARSPRQSPPAPTRVAPSPGSNELARVQERIATRRQQTSVVLTMLVLAGAAVATGHRAALAGVLGCVIAGIALAASLLMLTSDRHARILDLIANGHGELPAVERQRRRLLTASHRAQLAHSLRSLADEAPVRRARPSSGRPLYTPRVLTALAAELHATARLLSCERVGIAGVALTELLLTAHDSALYGTDTTRLRQELHRITFALQATHAPPDADPHDTPARG
jgi:hypothetical protein